MIEIAKISDPIEKAIILFLQISRNKFFYDVNKRMGRFMMNGWLLSQGYPAINVPARRAKEFHSGMIVFYETNNPNAMISFIISCYDPMLLETMRIQGV